MRQRPTSGRGFGRSLFVGLFLLASGASLAGGCGATINVVQCDDGEERCGDSCVDLDTDSKHCGECFSRCVDGCTDGVCDGGGQGGGAQGGGGPGQGGGGDCAPLTQCGGVCTDLDSDPFNCGGCGTFCSGGICAAGDCVDSCPGGFTDCGGACVDLSSNEANCGQCFFTCGPTEQCLDFGCVGGSCDLECGLCGLTELGSTTFLSITDFTSGLGDGFTSSCAGGPGAPEIGHRFVAPVSGTYFVDTFGSSFDTVLSVLDGCSELVCNDDTKSGQSQVVIDLFAGQEVIFVVDGFGAGASGQYTLTVRTDDIPVCPPGFTLCGDACVDTFSDHENCGGCFAPCGDEEACQDGFCNCVGPDCGECDTPTCNSCSSTTVLPSTVPITRSGSTVGQDDGISIDGCGTPAAPEQLFFFEAPFAASYRFDTFGSSYDTVLSLRSPGSCAEIACNDDWQNVDSFIETPLAAGQDVIVVVDGFGDAGDFQLHVEADIPLCAPILDGPLPIVEADETSSQADTFATSCIGSGAPERFYHFVAPTSRTYSFDTTGSDYDTVLEVLNGTCGGVSLGCNDDFDNVASRVEVFLEQDQLVTVIVDGWNGNSGNFVLTIQ